MASWTSGHLFILFFLTHALASPAFCKALVTPENTVAADAQTAVGLTGTPKAPPLKIPKWSIVTSETQPLPFRLTNRQHDRAAL